MPIVRREKKIGPENSSLASARSFQRIYEACLILDNTASPQMDVLRLMAQGDIKILVPSDVLYSPKGVSLIETLIMACTVRESRRARHILNISFRTSRYPMQIRFKALCSHTTLPA